MSNTILSQSKGSQKDKGVVAGRVEIEYFSIGFSEIDTGLIFKEHGS